jgi:TorA maturation chaperone TorD
MKLFVGPDKLIAPPWESVYRSKEGLLFQESTMTVREIYRTQGLHPEGYPHVADDGLALELDFLSRMTDRALKLVQSTDTEATVRGSDGTASAPSHANELTDMLRDNLTVQESFLRVHLLFWIPKLLERTNDSPTRLLYPQLTQMLLFFLQKDQEAVVELLGTLQ